MRSRICEVCAESYRPTYSDQRTCGRVCGVEFRRRFSRFGPPRTNWPSCRVVFADCARCARVFVRRRHAKYCSPGCAREAKLERDRADRPANRIWTAGPCMECGSAFVGERRTMKFCSEVCAKRSMRRRDKQKRSKRIRSIEARDRIGLATLAKRDGWRCHVCRRAVSRETWSMDHLVPLSAGGSHTWENVALAHKLCNSKRGTSGVAQLLLVG
jgi:hypothetical protein